MQPRGRLVGNAEKKKPQTENATPEYYVFCLTVLIKVLQAIPIFLRKGRGKWSMCVRSSHRETRSSSLCTSSG